MAGVLLVANPIAAQEPLVTDRPDFTESASVVGAGRVQLEGGFTATAAGEAREYALGELLLRIGIGDRLELRLAPNSYLVTDVDDGEAESDAGDAEGLEDASVGVKWLLADGATGAAAILASTSVPTGDDAFSSDAWEPELKLALARDLERAALGVNVGWAWLEGDDERRHSAIGSATVGLPLGERAGLFLETYGIATEGAGGEEAYADAGVTRLLSDDLQLDARVGVGLTGDSADWYVGVGAARRW